MAERPGGGGRGLGFFSSVCLEKEADDGDEGDGDSCRRWPLLRCVWAIRRATYASTRQVSVSSYNLFFQLMYSVCI